MSAAAVLLAVIVGTWSGNWFPSGRAEHRANPDVEAATIAAAGRLLARGIASLDPTGTEDVIISVGEMRGPRVVRELAAATGRTNLAVAVVSGYRRRDRFDYQQDAILTTLPVADASWSVWKRRKDGVQAPRGYAFAELVVSPAVTARVYAVHLKSNYGATTPEARADNRAKRAAAIGQIVEQERPRRGRAEQPVLILGDFNADRWRREFAEETIFATLEEANFANVLALLPPDRRGTYPNRRHGDSALDYIMLRGASPEGMPTMVPNDDLSDHNPVFVRVKF